MAHTIYAGIVLRNYFPQKKKVTILDTQLGKIDCVISQKSERILQHGALVQYRREAWHALYQLHDVELLETPAIWVQQDIYFLHHLLEISDFFLPSHSNACQIIDLFKILYCQLAIKNILFFKKAALCRFFALIGVCPDDAEKYDQFFFRLISAPIDIMLDVQDDVDLCKKMDRWLLGCIKTHPYADRLQTMHFFNYNG